MIRFDHLTKTFGDSPAVHDLSLEVPAGAFLVLLGPSGCGKSTTLRMLAGLEQPTAGSISIGDTLVHDAGRDLVPAGKRDLGLVFQSYALWPHMTVRRNVEWPLRVARWSKPERAARLREVLELLSIAELAERYPSELSGGQQQRVAIARTLGPKPGVLLLDEPLSNLDAKLRAEMRVELQRLHAELGTTTVYVTHDQTEAMALATHIAVMNAGKLEQLGSPADLLDRPASSFVARFVGSPPANVLPVSVGDGGRLRYGDAVLGVTEQHPPGSELDVSYSPSACRLESCPAAGTVAATVLERAPVAGRTVVTLETALGDRVTVVGDAGDHPVGARAHLVVPREPSATFVRAGTQPPT